MHTSAFNFHLRCESLSTQQPTTGPGFLTHRETFIMFSDRDARRTGVMNKLHVRETTGER